ncbi:ABC transporter ATP-binding protein [Caenibacillus caldisaponilyticus]|uniref:ABC transporter ATP-binding protein n=1 Tax=Caenibacillus caldisaponilyticus TaxID=1674942 RepID=UPI0009888C3B|nr:ATP-binding cassette domain-containing protein [Caenibacillus caldisaponilyticus]
MLQLKNVHKVFNEGQPDERVALAGIDLELKSGDFVTVIGSNGAGKSTLMNVITGVLAPDAGEIWMDGKEVTRLPEFKRSARIGRVFQDPMAGTAASLTIEENLSIAFTRNKTRTLARGVTKKRRAFFRERLAELNLGLENRLTAKVGSLSGGERQALSLLMATLTYPSLLLLDEHTAALDPARAALIAEMTERIVRASRLTTLMVTHNMQQAIALGNRLVMMDAGRIVAAFDEEEKKTLTIEKLLAVFQQMRSAASDRLLLNAFPPGAGLPGQGGE